MGHASKPLPTTCATDQIAPRPLPISRAGPSLRPCAYKRARGGPKTLTLMPLTRVWPADAESNPPPRVQPAPATPLTRVWPADAEGAAAARLLCNTGSSSSTTTTHACKQGNTGVMVVVGGWGVGGQGQGCSRNCCRAGCHKHSTCNRLCHAVQHATAKSSAAKGRPQPGASVPTCVKAPPPHAHNHHHPSGSPKGCLAGLRACSASSTSGCEPARAPGGGRRPRLKPLPSPGTASCCSRATAS